MLNYFKKRKKSIQQKRKKKLLKEILKNVRQVEIRTNHFVDQNLAGEYHSVFKGQGLNFDRVREYSPGDEVRTIDWNVTARTGKPHVKVYVEERQLTVLLMLDISASGEFGSQEKSKRELAAEFAATLAFSASKNNDRVGLLLFTNKVEKYIAPDKGNKHLLRLIRETLYFQPTSKETSIESALDYANKVIKRHCTIFLISDFRFGSYSEKNVKNLASKLNTTNKHHDLIAIGINDPREETIPNLGILTIEDPETGEILEINTQSLKNRNRMKNLEESRKDDVRKLIISQGVNFLDLSTDQNYLPKLLAFFKNRNTVR